MLAVLKEKKKKKKEEEKGKPGHERREAGASGGTKDRDSNPGKDVYMRVPYILTYHASSGRRWGVGGDPPF